MTKKVIAIASAVALLSFLPFHNGDMNRDGSVTITDLVLVRQAIGGFDSQADLNCDGVIDEDDLNAMRVKLAEGN